MSNSSSQKSLDRSDIHIKKINMMLEEEEDTTTEVKAGIDGEGNTFCTQAKFTGGHDLDELD